MVLHENVKLFVFSEDESPLNVTSVSTFCCNVALKFVIAIIGTNDTARTAKFSYVYTSVFRCY
jgi:hypothetical protein